MIESIREKQEQSKELLAQLERQLSFEAKYGIAPHEIRSIRIRGRGYKDVQSWVTMSDGTEHHLRGVDVKHVLDGEK